MDGALTDQFLAGSYHYPTEHFEQTNQQEGKSPFSERDKPTCSGTQNAVDKAHALSGEQIPN